MTDSIEIRRLTLQIQRDLLERGSLRLLLAARNAVLAGHREDLRALKARAMRRRRPGPSR